MILFVLLTSSASFLLNKIIETNSLYYIKENLNYTERELLHDLWISVAALNINDTGSPFKKELDQIQNDKDIPEHMKDQLKTDLEESTLSLLKKGLIKPGSTKHSALPNFELTIKGAKVELYGHPKYWHTSLKYIRERAFFPDLDISQLLSPK